MSTERDELAKIYVDTLNAGHGVVNRPAQGLRAAAAILAAGYRKPAVLGYIVVDRDGSMVGPHHENEVSAQTFAAEWTKDCKDAGIDWEYRVATITEATK